MSFHVFDPEVKPSVDPEYLESFPGRAEILKHLGTDTRYDVLIVGGGIHGAALARTAAFNGLSTVLLERSDYAAATSSRSSKMAHGGLRYLELFDFRQVFEGIRAREDLFETAPHLVHPSRFVVPVKRGQPFFRAKLGLGLTLYDLFLKNREHRHHWLDAAALKPADLGAGDTELAGWYQYTDGIMDDARLVIENIVSARQEGATCLNYARVDSLTRVGGEAARVGWTDALTGTKHELSAGIVFNCTGPWAPYLGRLNPGELKAEVRYSQGTHLLFNRPWRAPSLLLPLGKRGSYYFVWPHAGGTMVGTTEREIKELPADPEPTESEVTEILERLKHDLPKSGLDRSSLYYGFSGVRTLPARSSQNGVTRLSRRHQWSYRNGILTLLGGKFTTAYWTAQEGLKIAFGLVDIKRSPVPLRGRKLPGATRFAESVAHFEDFAATQGIPAALVGATIARLGARARYLASDPSHVQVLGGEVLSGDLEIALKVEQAESLGDLMRRRLNLELLPGHGLKALPNILSALKAHRPELDCVAEEANYRERLRRVRGILNLPPTA